MMADAERGMFELVVVKDLFRFARNTVHLLQNIRKLKSLGIETQFLTANMTSMGNSEFVLTIFGALAQGESENMSKRVKFGNNVSAEKGKVSNIVFGYDKAKGKLFDLAINEREAETIREIFRQYCEDEDGAMKIAQTLNAQSLFIFNADQVQGPRVVVPPRRAYYKNTCVTWVCSGRNATARTAVPIAPSSMKRNS